MSKFVELMIGAAKSNTVQFNAVFLAIWAAILNADFVQGNPDLVQALMGVQAIVNLLLRFKTNKPLSQR
jgi:hypothetical protein